MAAQQGFQYEKNVAAFLKKVNLVSPSFNPAGSTSDRADLEMTYKKKKINVELKITAASGGSLVLKYDAKKPKGQKWGFDDVSGDPEKKFLADLAKKSGALARINKEWSDVPLKRSSYTPEEKKAIDKIAKDKRYNIDLVKFKEINEELNGKVVADYYAMKDTYYVNIGTSGFYLFGNNDPNNLNEECTKKKLPQIPKFSESAKVKYRARVQYKGSGNYQFTFELSFSLPVSKNSPYNIGPCSGEGNVSIQKGKANISCFL